MRAAPRLTVLAAALCVSPGAAQQLAAEFAAVRDRVLPTAEELEWRAIPWRDSLGGAVLEADEVERPVLLWAMNGHPLGCT